MTHDHRHIERGDIVFDLAGHVDVFTDVALRRGASKVVAIKLEPRNFECLRRNLDRKPSPGV